MLTNDSIAEIDEAQLVERLLADPDWHSRIVELYGIPNDALDFQRVPLEGIPAGADKGDIDILRCPLRRPDLATAIEVKRVKVGLNAIRTGKPNKLTGLEEGVVQANRLARVGFYQVYLFVMVVVDSREQNLGQNSYAGASLEIESLISRAVSLSERDLHATVGLYYCEFTQPMDYAPLDVGAFYGHLVRRAETVTQTTELTGWVSQTIARDGQA